MKTTNKRGSVRRDLGGFTRMVYVCFLGENGEGEEREKKDQTWEGFCGIFLWYIKREMKC